MFIEMVVFRYMLIYLGIIMEISKVAMTHKFNLYVRIPKQRSADPMTSIFLQDSQLHNSMAVSETLMYTRSGIDSLNSTTGR